MTRTLACAGGNAQKSAAARTKKMEKAKKQGGGGGGGSGITDRAGDTEGKMGAAAAARQVSYVK